MPSPLKIKSIFKKHAAPGKDKAKTENV